MTDPYRNAYNTWQEKTEWVQHDPRFNVLKPWGKHRADVLREYIERLESRDQFINDAIDTVCQSGAQNIGDCIVAIASMRGVDK